MFRNKVIYLYDPWNTPWIQKLLKYEKNHWEESIKLRWTYGKEWPCSKETFHRMKNESDVTYIKEKEFNEKFKEFEEIWKKDETFYILDPGVIWWTPTPTARRILKYERKWGKEEITIFDQNWKEISCDLSRKLEELEYMLVSDYCWDRWDCREISEESANETLEKWRTGK